MSQNEELKIDGGYAVHQATYWWPSSGPGIIVLFMQ